MSAAAGLKPPGLRKREDLSVHYYPGIGSGGADEILRPTLMTVGEQGRCYRIVRHSFGKKEEQLWTRGAASAGSSGSKKSEYEQSNWSSDVGDSSNHRHGPVGAGPVGAERHGPLGERHGPLGAERHGPLGAERQGPLGAESHGNRKGYGVSHASEHGSQSSRLPYFQDDVYDEGQESELDLEGLEQIPSERGGGYSLCLPIPPAFFKFIIGAKGVTRSNIEEDTKCKLKIPRKGQDGDLVIEGATPAIISHGKQRVEMVVWNSRFKEEPNYFISIPLNLPQQTERLRNFKKEVIDVCGKDVGVVPELFQDPACFHITLGVLRIFSQEEEKKAIRVLQEAITEARAELRDPSVALTIVLQGLDSMNDDVSTTRVVYSRVKSTDSTNRLQNFVDSVSSRVIRGAPELMKREFERDGVKLHATVMNCSYLALRDDSAMEMEVHRGRRRQKPKETFDATGMFKQFKSYDFGKLDLSNIHLSKRFERDADGYYKCIHNYAI